MVGFHGNGEDVGNSRELAKQFNQMNVAFLAVEYPGYSHYTQEKPTETGILENALHIYEYLVKEIGVSEKDIILLGRSLGTASALHIGKHFNPGTILLLSPFTSIRAVAGDVLFHWATKVMKDMFNNLAIIHKVQSPVLIVHGKKDSIVDHSHSRELIKEYQGKVCELIMREELGHGDFHYANDIIIPLIEFWEHNGIELKTTQSKSFRFPVSISKNPHL